MQANLGEKVEDNGGTKTPDAARILVSDPGGKPVKADKTKRFHSRAMSLDKLCLPKMFTRLPLEFSPGVGA
ncbi:MAG: hypothetical protein ACUVRM_10510 [Bacillota bacterium]